MADNDVMLTMLTSSARDLCQVIENGISTGIIKITEGYEDMVTGPMGAVKHITDQLPGGAPQWTGELHEDEVEVERIQTIGDDRHETGPTGCRLTHKPTGITREAQGSGDFDRNKQSAWLSLAKAVEKRYAEMGV